MIYIWYCKKRESDLVGEGTIQQLIRVINRIISRNQFNIYFINVTPQIRIPQIWLVTKHLDQTTLAFNNILQQKLSPHKSRADRLITSFPSLT